MAETITTETIKVEKKNEDEGGRVTLRLRAPVLSQETVRDFRARVAALRATGVIGSGVEAVGHLIDGSGLERITDIENSKLINNEAMFGGDVYEYTIIVNKI